MTSLQLSNLFLVFDGITTKCREYFEWNAILIYQNNSYHICSHYVAQMAKHLSAVWETLVRSLGWEDPLEKEMAAHSSTLAWKIPWMEEPGRLQPVGSQRVGHDWATSPSPYGWFTVLYSFQVYNIVIQSFYRLDCIKSYCKMLALFPVLHNISPWLFDFTQSSWRLLIPSLYVALPPTPLLLTGDCWFVFCICEPVSL